MSLIKGITINLYEKKQIGTDGFNRPIHEETPVKVDNVLVAPASSDDVTAQNNLSGKKAMYSLAIPKGDTHDWENRTVEFFGKNGRQSEPRWKESSSSFHSDGIKR